MAFTVHKKILTSRSPFFRSMLASTPTPVSLNTALNGVIKSTIDAQANPDAMTDVEITTPEAQVKPEVKAEEPRDSKSITPENGATTLILGDDDVTPSSSMRALPDDDHVLMTGPVEYEYEGRFDPKLFAETTRA